MTETRWQEVRQRFLEAIDKSEGELGPFLRELERADAEISAQVRELLDQSSQNGPNLSGPCWTPDPDYVAPHSFDPGRRLADRFEIVEFLGAGGLGEVYRAFDNHQQIFVAVKTLRSGPVSDRRALGLLRNELNTARSVTHTNVCRLYDVHWGMHADDPPFFTMELIEGQTLSRWLATNGPLSTEAAYPLVMQVIEGLSAAHEQGIVHRDFKAGNVMLTGEPARAVIMDFGLARNLGAAPLPDITSPSATFAGTPAYMAPEQLRGETAGFAADIHALGVVMYEMVTGRRPFSGATPIEIASARLNGSAESPRHWKPGLDRSWEHAILECLQADPSKRPASVLVVKGLLNSAPPRFRFKRRTIVITGIAGATLAIAAGVSRFVTGPEAVAIEVADIDNQTGDAAFAYLCRGTTTEVMRRLSKIQSLSVIPRHGISAQLQRGNNRFLLEGALQRNAENLRIGIQLLDRSFSKVIWSESFVRQVPYDMLGLQTEIADGVATQLDHYLTTINPARKTLALSVPAGSPTSNGPALDYYMRARFLLEEASAPSIRAAVPFLQKAVEEDPGFALAWSALAEAHLALAAYVTGTSEALRNRARECAEQAVGLDPKLAEAQLSLAAVRQDALDWPGAEASYREALRLKPGFSRAHRWYAGFVVQFGRFDEALQHARLALQQDPYDVLGPMAIGLYLLFAGRPREAITLLESSNSDRDLDGLQHNLGQAYARMAQLSSGTERQEWLRKAQGQCALLVAIEHRRNRKRPLLSDRLYALVWAIDGKSGMVEPYLEHLTEDMNNGLFSPADVALIHALRRNYPEALRLLDEAYAMHARSLLYIKVNPFLENLRDQPGFALLVQKLRL